MGVDSEGTKYKLTLDLHGSERRRPQTSQSRVPSSPSSLSSSFRSYQDTSRVSSASREPGEHKVKKNVFFSNETSSGNTDNFDQSSNASSDNGVFPDRRSPVRSSTVSSPRGTPIRAVAKATRDACNNNHASNSRSGSKTRRPPSSRPATASTDTTLRRGRSAKTRPTSQGQPSPKGSENVFEESKSTSARSSRRRVLTGKTKTPVKMEKTSVHSDDDSDSDASSTEPASSPRTLAGSLPQSPTSAAELAALSSSQRQAWAQFETHVKNIDDSTELISRQPRKTFHASNAFQSVMYDLYGNTEYGKSRGFTKFSTRVGHVATFASRFIGRVKSLNAQRNEEQEDEEEYFEDEVDFQPSRETVENAKRGWKILRQYVQELAAEKRMSQTTLTWNMLRHTIKGLSNMERARYDLYRRYGIIPTVLSDGTVVQENSMLSERARSAQANRTGSIPSNQSRGRFSNSATVRRPSMYQPSIGGFSGQMTQNRYTISR
ncbi:uncharacterized serine-rich protein C215.13 [Aplysia californica]|uniref:Uncharacterized serine-rich protein C215.13 n=1 Tax=Aplysia californica TaxID=6500 RepID=A0ABM0JZE0_APLCA|nr:uncharacterized serine-rich protein C215.13 [Aplysia californica]